MSDDQPLEFVHCQDCTAPVVLVVDPTSGYKLICGCHARGVELSTETQSSSLFEPISGKWSTVDDVDVPSYNTDTE